jgi:hypothetical protein
MKINKYFYNIGFLGIGIYSRKSNTKAYKYWLNMLSRCYSKDFHKVRPTYKDCSVHKDWHNFQNFAKWFEQNYVEGYHLDKDILIKGNKIYSRNNCVFVPIKINSLLLKCGIKRGDYPIGISKHGNMFRAKCQIKGIQTIIGSYKTKEEAFEAYRTAKESEIKRIANIWWDNLSESCYQGLISYKIDIND